MSFAGTVSDPRPVVPGEVRARFIWCGIVVALLVLQVVLGFAAVALAMADASFAVVPDYDERALRWDELQTVERKSADLDWSEKLSISETADALGRRSLAVELHDRFGRSVAGARVGAVVFHHARANQVRKVMLAESTVAGTYEMNLPMRQNGLWEVRLDVCRGRERFVATRQVEVGVAPEGRL